MNYLAFAIFIIFSLIGFLGIIIPGLPDIIFILVGIIIYGALTHFHTISLNLILIVGGLTILSYFFDYLGVVLGAKKFGASKFGIFGAILGGIIGFIIFNILGFIVGAICGTAIFEIIFAQKDFRKALKAGLGAFFGLLFGVVLKIILAITIIALFLKAIL